MSRQLRISITAKKVKEEIRLIFSDNGTGMDLEKIGDRLFTPFNRFSSIQDGKGIGLYMIKGMAESNGGRVLLDSQPGIGTTFEFILVPYQS